MIVILSLFGVIVGCCLIYLWVKFIYWIFPSDKKNPYIEKHKAIIDDGRNYKAYLKWLDSKGGEVPLKQFKTPEQTEAERQIDSLLK